MGNKDSSVEKLKRKLYTRGEKPKLRERRVLHEIEAEEEVKKNWSEEEGNSETDSGVAPEQKSPQETLHDLYEGRIEGVEPEAEAKPKEKRELTSLIIKIFFIASFLFFLSAVGIAAYFLIGGKNQVSCKNVDITIAAPQALASGKRVALDVAVVNNNPVPMRNATIEVQFPKGTRDINENASNLTSVNKQIGTLEVTEQVRSSFQAILFGQEKSVQIIKAQINYEIDDSNASFSCSKEHAVNIATAPLSLSVDGLEEISSGQEVELTMTVTSNAEELVPDQRLVIDYPFGFEFVSAEPEPNHEDNVWELGDIAPNKERVVVLRGVVQGQGTESRAISITVGEKDKANNQEVEIVFQKVQHPLLVTRPFLELALSFEDSGRRSETQTGPIVTAKLDSRLTGTLKWKNTLPDTLHNVEIDLVIDGTMLKPATVSAGNGFFRSIDNTIVWTPQTTDEAFRSLRPGEEGTFDFTFETEPYEKGSSVENPVMYIESNVRAHRISDDRPVPQNLIGQTKKRILFDTELIVDAYALYGIGPFTNTGPHPPKANEKTTYTVAWEVHNTVNDVSGVTVKGVLPVYAQWLDAFSPQNESIAFNPVTREVIWSLDEVKHGTGNSTQIRNVFFQVAVTPSITQVSKRLSILEDIEIQGVDEFTKNVIKSEAGDITTSLNRDPFFNDKWKDRVGE